MIGAASSLQVQDSGGTVARADGLPLDVLERRVGHRRRMYATQAASNSLVSLALLVYGYAGTVSIVIPSAYFLCSVG